MQPSPSPDPDRPRPGHGPVRWAAVVALLVAGTIALTPAGGMALDPGGTFQDDNGSVHEGTIEAIAAAGITFGCNPPVDDRFCPTRAVTRAEMATFLVRALDLPAAPSAGFTDTAGSVHATDIDAIAAASITYGCNPPDNDRYCPDQPVTRDQMASLLVRALHLPASGDAGFVDIAGSVHAADIDAIAAASITYGCNPPDDDRYCPRDAVTREQMASFLARALHLDPIIPPPPLPAVSPTTAVHIGTDNWLYYGPTVNEACLPDSVFARVLQELAKVEAVVKGSGREVVYAVVPNKAVIYPENVPEAIWTQSCAHGNDTRLRNALETSGDAGLVLMWDEMEARAGSEDLYFKHDTHWNGEGALLGAELMAAEAAPGVWNEAVVSASPASRAGDLAAILGIDWRIDYEDHATALPGATTDVIVEPVTTHGRPVTTYESSGSAALDPTRTVMLHDSFLYHASNKLGPLYEQVTFVPWFAYPVADPVRPFLTASDRIVIETAERNVAIDLIGTGTAGQLAAALADDFTQTPVTFGRDGDEVAFTLPAGSGVRYLVVEADVSETVDLGSRYDIDIPATEPAWPNELNPEASRYGFEILGTPTTLRVPLPQSVTVTGAFVIVVPEGSP